MNPLIFENIFMNIISIPTDFWESHSKFLSGSLALISVGRVCGMGESCSMWVHRSCKAAVWKASNRYCVCL